MSIYQGKKLKIEITGSSHEDKIYGRAEGFPENEEIDFEQLKSFMSRRAPGRYAGSTARREPDIPFFFSGLKGNRTDGTLLGLYIENKDVRKNDYAAHKNRLRPGHADLGAYIKYGKEYDMSGGGKFSGRMTAPICALGGISMQILERRGITVTAHILTLSDVQDLSFYDCTPDDGIKTLIQSNILPAISSGSAAEMCRCIEKASAEGDSLGGVIECEITGFPGGIGGELFDGIEAQIAQWMFAIPAVKGVEFGSGFRGTRMRGSENNDPIIIRDGKVVTESNYCGGILGGISTGMPILFSVAIKPTPSISKEQRTVDVNSMTETIISVTGRHDACIVPRAAVVVEAAASLAVLDLLET